MSPKIFRQLVLTIPKDSENKLHSTIISNDMYRFIDFCIGNGTPNARHGCAQFNKYWDNEQLRK